MNDFLLFTQVFYSGNSSVFEKGPKILINPKNVIDIRPYNINSKMANGLGQIYEITTEVNNTEYSIRVVSEYLDGIFNVEVK